MLKQVRIGIKELRFIAIECDKCHARITLYLEHNDTGIPFECPSCREIFDEQSIRQPLHDYRNSFRALSKLKQNVTFEVSFTV